MKEFLLNPEVQGFINEHYKEDIASFILKGSPFPEISVQEIATQLEGKKKAEKKLPTWFSSEKILYPRKLNLSQTSSEITANYKADLVSGKILLDLTGGFGIDSFFFSKKIDKIVHCELDKELSQLAEHNFKALKLQQNIKFFHGNGIEFLRETPQSFDWIYIDPSRRTRTGKKVFKLEDSEPNIIENLALFFEKGKSILLKTSPLLDIRYGISAFKNVLEIHVIAIRNDVKELLWILSPRPSTAEIRIKTINFSAEKEIIFEGDYSDDQNFQSTFSHPLNYLYEPNSALLKAGLFNSLSLRLGINKLHPNSHLYTSDHLVDFPGRTFKVHKSLPFKTKVLKRELNMNKANISVRNFPKSVEQLKKQFSIKDGGDYYLFFTTDLEGQQIVISGLKPNNFPNI